MPAVDEIHYVRVPGALGGRAEMTRLVYALSGRPYRDVLHPPGEFKAVVEDKNPFRQFPVVTTPDGESVYQTLAIMHRAAQGTTAWPGDPQGLTQALAVGMGGYDLYQAFAAFRPDDVDAKKRFEEKKAPQFFRAFEEIYAGRSFAAGDAPCFADCIVYEAVGWCVRRNEACQRLLDDSPSLRAFQDRFRAVPAIAAFLERQAAARAEDDSL